MGTKIFDLLTLTLKFDLLLRSEYLKFKWWYSIKIEIFAFLPQGASGFISLGVIYEELLSYPQHRRPRAHAQKH